MRAQILKDSSTESLVARFSRRPTSCTCTLYDTDGTTLAAAAAASLGPSTTISAACGYGQDDRRALRVTSVAGLKFLGVYLARNASGQRESVRLLSLPSSGICTVEDLLTFAYASGDILESAEVTRTITATESATLGVGYRARFVATMPDSTIETRDAVWDVVAHRLEQPFDESRLAELAPMLLKLQPAQTRGTTWAQLLAAAWDALLEDFVTRGVRPRLYLDESRLTQLLLARLRWMLAEDGLTIGQEEYPFQAARHFKAEYLELLTDSLTRASYYSARDNGNLTNDDDEPVRRRRVL